MANPLEPSEALKPPLEGHESTANPHQHILPGDSATTQAEKIERHGDIDGREDFEESPSKRVKIEHHLPTIPQPAPDRTERPRGVAPIKPEFLIDVGAKRDAAVEYDDDAAEAGGKAGGEQAGGRGGKKTKGGQNKSRNFGSSRDAIQLCRSRHWAREFDPVTCSFGDKCKHEHDIRKYLASGKREDLQTFNGLCPKFELRGKCSDGWKCRWAGSHSEEIEHEDGRKELVQVQRDTGDGPVGTDVEEMGGEDERAEGVVNIISNEEKIVLRKKKKPTPQSDKYLEWLNKLPSGESGNSSRARSGEVSEKHDNRADYIEPPLRPSEKRRIYYGPETPVLAPLTTQGNLPFRRLCVELGAQITWSEMAMGLPLISGEKQEWALMKAHESELSPPAYSPKNPIQGYDNTKDIRFGAQIAANKPWLALKTTEILASLCPQLRAIDLNCGCPIDLVYRSGAGSALLDSHGKLEKILRGMNTVSGEVPITVKIRMGTKDKHPNAEKLVQRLVLGGDEAQDLHLGPAGVAAITLHGRSRQQRYTRSADWEYIAECASLVKKLRQQRADVTDTTREPDARDLPNTKDGMPYFCGNGDILSHHDYNTHMEHSRVDSIMIGRGALVKPWVFEEIEKNQYLDKSATERLGYIERFCRNGLSYWGSDEIGVGNTRKFLLEWLSFSCRYVPLGILEYLPPKFGDRPPAYHGRSELETLLSSANYKDWIKIRWAAYIHACMRACMRAIMCDTQREANGFYSEMFLGPAHKDFQFQPKHKSNSFEIEAEG
jgi:tRNA-dihydrouridine synthase 3